METFGFDVDLSGFHDVVTINGCEEDVEFNSGDMHELFYELSGRLTPFLRRAFVISLVLRRPALQIESDCTQLDEFDILQRHFRLPSLRVVLGGADRDERSYIQRMLNHALDILW
jgi:hypothetical protein